MDTSDTEVARRIRAAWKIVIEALAQETPKPEADSHKVHKEEVAQ